MKAKVPGTNHEFNYNIVKFTDINNQSEKYRVMATLKLPNGPSLGVIRWVINAEHIGHAITIIAADFAERIKVKKDLAISKGRMKSIW